ncbi:MAG: TRAP transporter fused permease subunit [Desulfobacterales bacterium]|nr:TRAP transporter fused permease subunit [Desulfobacterales bacterium]
MANFDWLTSVKGSKRTLQGGWAVLYSACAIFMALWYLYTSGFGVVSTETNRGFYLLFTSVLVYLLFPASRWAPMNRPSVYDLVCVVLVSVSIGYWIDQYMAYAINRVSDPSVWDITMGVIAIVMIMETARRAVGIIMGILAVIFLTQIYFGPYLPGKLSHNGMPWVRIIEFTFCTQEAMFGVITTTFATFVFPFMIFGAFLERSGAGEFFMELGKALTGKWRGGPAKIATVTSALFGSISGSSVANVVATGTFTIPMMKRIGFRPKVAGAIEAIASTGGQFMPPIMGAGVFILATLIEVDYLKIALMNVLPALIYFIFVLFMVDLEALRSGLKGLPPKEIPKLAAVLKRGWHFFLPIVIVLGLLFYGYSPEVGAFWGTASALVLSWRHRKTRMNPSSILLALRSGASSNNSAGSAIGSLGIIIGGIVLSGLGLKFSAILVETAAGNLLLCVVMVMLISIIIGMGSSTTGSYIILSVVAAPALIQLEVPPIAAHLVVFYAACLSNITPPVCVSAFAAAALAGADPMETGLSALKFGIALIFLPFAFVYLPPLLLDGPGWLIAYTFVILLIGFAAAAMALQGADFFSSKISKLRRAVFTAAALLLLLPVPIWANVIGLAALLIVWLPGYRARERTIADADFQATT